MDLAIAARILNEEMIRFRIKRLLVILVLYRFLLPTKVFFFLHGNILALILVYWTVNRENKVSILRYAIKINTLVIFFLFFTICHLYATNEPKIVYQIDNLMLAGTLWAEGNILRLLHEFEDN